MTSRAAEQSRAWITAAIICCVAAASQLGVSGAAIDIEKNQTPFPLELQPPLIDNLDAIDSYGNPIKYSQPIETPDGRKVISAQGVQFEIPNYASGITEIKKPIDSLVPPFIAATEPTTKATSKITFNKSDQGKVISNNVKPLFGFFQGPVPSGFTSATQTPVGFAKATTISTDFTGKYTGSFGGAPGFLGGQNRPGYAVQPDGSIRDPDHTVAPRTKVTAPLPTAPVATVPSKVDAITKRGYSGSFGGPPGVLVPFDNVKGA